MRWDLVRRSADPLLGLAVAALYAVEAALWGPAEPVTLLAACWVGCLGLTLRRRSPLVGFLLAAGSVELITRIEPGFDNDSGALVITFMVSIYSLGRHTDGIERWFGAVGVLTVMVLFALEDVEGTMPDTGDLGFLLAFVGGPWAAGLAIRLRRERERALRERNRTLHRDREAVARAAVTAERARIARELHDVVSHAIAVTVLQARGGRRLIGRDDAAVRSALDAIELTNTQALGDMRRLLAVLRDTDEPEETRMAPQPSLDNLDRLVQQVRDAGLSVEVAVDGETAEIPPGVDLSAYRIVQEGLTNVLKHAGPGARAQVLVRRSPSALTVSVTDDGHGSADRVDADARAGGAGRGLIGIRERVGVIGGSVEAHPTPGGGFTLSAHLPFALEQLETDEAAR